MKKILSLLAVFCFILVGCTSSNTTEVLKRATVETESLDIAQASYTQTFDLYASFYEPLYVINGEGIVTPGVAKALPTISEDGLTYTIELRDDAQ